MFDIEKDFNRMKILIDKNSVDDTHRYVYFSSNEDLKKLFSSFSLYNMDVLSVIGSGDQAFHFINNGVNYIDLYDKNIFSIYYFYLRMWIIDYYKMFYPKYPFSYDYFSRLLEKIIPNSQEEEKALLFWRKCINKIDINKLGKLFFSKSYRYENYIGDVSNLNRKIKNSKYRIYNCDIAGKTDFDRTYDVIFISNIIDHLSNIDEVKLFKDNLVKLLNNNGIVIASKICSCSISVNEKKVFSNDFDLHTLTLNEDDERTKYLPGYYYTKKKVS